MLQVLQNSRVKKVIPIEYSAGSASARYLCKFHQAKLREEIRFWEKRVIELEERLKTYKSPSAILELIVVEKVIERLRVWEAHS